MKRGVCHLMVDTGESGLILGFFFLPGYKGGVG